jgi:hypothetical protein
MIVMGLTGEIISKRQGYNNDQQQRNPGVLIDEIDQKMELFHYPTTSSTTTCAVFRPFQ